jgi:hypothetical protein
MQKCNFQPDPFGFLVKFGELVDPVDEVKIPNFSSLLLVVFLTGIQNLKKEYFFFWHNVAHKNCSKFGPN